MPTQIERLSLNMSLSDRYLTQKLGGSFDAKNIPIAPGQRGSNGGSGFGLQDTLYTKPAFRISSLSFLQQSDFKNDGKDLSIYSKGLDTTKYKS